MATRPSPSPSSLDAEAAAPASSTPATAPVDVAPFAAGPVLAIAALTVVAMVAGAARYGYHRDELYYLWGGEHLDWGFVDHPPLVPLLARAIDVVAGGHSLVALRLVAALVVAWSIAAGALIARDLGGTRRAQILAAVAVAVTPATRAPEMLFGTTAIDAAVWATLLVVAVRLLRSSDTRLWIPFGVVAGLGLETKWSVAVLAGALVLGILVSDRRALLRSPYLLVGGALAALLWAPNLWWNATHGWPTLEFQRSVAEEFGALDQRLLFLPMQLLLTGVLTVVLWGAGLVALVRRSSLGSRFRPLGWATLIAVGTVFLAGGKPYYVAPLFVALFAAGAVVVDRAGDRSVRRVAVVLGVVAVVGIPMTLPVLPAAELGAVAPINPEMGEMVGWPELAAAAEGAFAALPPEQRADAIVLTSNYGSAGAVHRFAPALPVHSAHNSWWDEGPPPATTATVVSIGYPAGVLERFCGSIVRVGVVTNDAGLDNDEHDRPILLCTDLTRPWPAIWADLRHVE